MMALGIGRQGDAGRRKQDERHARREEARRIRRALRDEEKETRAVERMRMRANAQTRDEVSEAISATIRDASPQDLVIGFVALSLAIIGAVAVGGFVVRRVAGIRLVP